MGKIKKNILESSDSILNHDSESCLKFIHANVTLKIIDPKI